MWWVNADAVDWDILTAIETDTTTAANSVPVAADATLSALLAIFTTATPPLCCTGPLVCLRPAQADGRPVGGAR